MYLYNQITNQMVYKNNAGLYKQLNTYPQRFVEIDKSFQKMKTTKANKILNEYFDSKVVEWEFEGGKFQTSGENLDWDEWEIQPDVKISEHEYHSENGKVVFHQGKIFYATKFRDIVKLYNSQFRFVKYTQINKLQTFRKL